MRRWCTLLALFAMSCAAQGGVDGESQALSAEPAALAQPLSSTIPTRYTTVEKAQELAAELATTQKVTTMEDLASTHTYLQGVGDAECAFTGLCGSGGGQYSGCIFGYCAWCSTQAQCFFEDGTANIGVTAPCDSGPCKKP